MNVQPIERNTVTYFLYFDKEDLTVQIDKPEGIEKSDFEIKQNQDGYGRYITFADEIDVIFTPRKNYQFSKLCQMYREKKWQNSAYFIMKIDDMEFIRARLKFNDVTTDFTYHFTIKIDNNTVQEIIESKKTTTVNLVSPKSVDDKDITPIEMVGVLTKFKKFFIDNRIELNQTEYPYYVDCSGDYGDPDAEIKAMYINMFNKSLNSGEETIVVEGINTLQGVIGSELLFTRFVAASNNTSITLRINNLNFDILFTTPVIAWGAITVLDKDGLVKQNEDLWDITTSNANIKIDFLEREITLNKDETLYVSNNITRGQRHLSGGINFLQKPSLQLFTVSIFEDTITKSSRLIDIGKQCLKSITNDAVTVVAPRFTEPGGNFYDLYGTSGLFLRQYNDQPFYTSWSNFKDYIRSSFNCDFQVNGNNVFIGHQTDFYQDIEMERFPFSPNKDSFKTSNNTNIMKSGFFIGYDKYEDDTASSNTIDSIHVSSEWYLPDSQPLEDASDENNIKYVADQYMIENIRRESFNKDSTKTVPNDKEIYVFDTFTDSGILQNRNNQGFEVENLYSPETCYNLRLSTKRMIIDYFSEHLSNISQFTKDVISWKNTSYLNNREAKTKCTNPSIPTTSLELIEGEDITPEQLPPPFLDGFLYEFDLALRVKFNQFWELADKILNQKGYVTFFSKEGVEIKIFISSLKYNWENEKLYAIIGERKYE